ncbi:MAG: ADP-ribosylglycohydrolase family protein [Polyangiaceae bacterium]|nr:ADP-ribosylglycohydrolase family protein [Polyangiaceae bacterium]
MGSVQREEADRVRGCLLGGAVGDALGAPIEFDDLARIQARFGPAGVRDFAEAYGREGAITDDTQMTLFTAEGLLRAVARGAHREPAAPGSAIHHAYLRWYFTQGSRPRAVGTEGPEWPDGWLVREARLSSRRGPGVTCLSALGAATRSFGEPARNDSKGCGTVMRVAPIGLVAASERLAYELGAEASAVTHGHPTGIVAGGAFAMLIAHLQRRLPLAEAIARTRAFIAERPASGETLRALDASVALARGDVAPAPAAVESLGGGWVAEEALAIAVYCALVARSFEHGVLLAVNHSGDSDSTGSMTGQLLGLTLGLAAIPERWLARVELRDVIETLAADLAALRAGAFDASAHRERYPGG